MKYKTYDIKHERIGNAIVLTITTKGKARIGEYGNGGGKRGTLKIVIDDE